MARAVVTPIQPGDLDRVGEFLHRSLNPGLSAADWARAVQPPWQADSPNHGFMLVDGNNIVGVYLAYYSNRTIDGRNERFCNLAAWCVAPTHRLNSFQLLRALLAQPGFHFTDLSPSGNTLPINERLKFKRLDTATALMPNLPLPSWLGPYRASLEPAVIERALTGADLQIYRDHRHAQAAHHLVMSHRDEHCYVIFRRDRRKKLPLFASVLYVSNPALFQRMARFFGGQLLLRYGIPVTLMELRVVGGEPSGSFRLRSPRPKMYKSDSLQPERIDYLYSELVCVRW